MRYTLQNITIASGYDTSGMVKNGKGSIAMVDKLNNENWYAVIETLLKSESQQFTLQVDKTGVTILDTPQNIQKIATALRQMLATSANFFKNLPYSVQFPGLDTPTQMGTASNPTQVGFEMPQLQDSVEQGKAIFENLFGVDTFTDLVLNHHALLDAKLGATSTNHVLYSKPVSGKFAAKLLHHFLEALLANFNDVSADQLREIVLNAHVYLPRVAKEASELSDHYFSGLIQRCFGVVERGQTKQVQMYFDYGLLYRFLFPPKLEVKQIADDPSSGKASLRIDKQHFLNYLQQLTQGGVLLRVYKPDALSNILHARPILWASEHVISMPHQYTIVLDRSGSMADHLAKMGQDVIQFIELLRAFDNEAKVRLVYFEEQVGPVAEFKVSENDNIKTFINKAIAGGSTRLFSTLEEELDKMQREKTTRYFNSVMVVFTDGIDNQSGVRVTALQRIADKFNAFKSQGLTAPRVFTMGLGKYDHDALYALATHTHSPFIHLQTQEDFKQVYQYLHSIQFEQKIVKLLIKAGTSQQFTVPVSLDGNAQMPGILIPFEEGQPFEITLNDNKMVVLVKDKNNIPTASRHDKINAVFLSVNQVILANEKNPQEQILALAAIKDDLDKFTQRASQPIDVQSVISEIQKLIEHYRFGLQQVIANNDQALHHGLLSLAKQNIGYDYAEIDNTPTMACDPQHETCEQTQQQRQEQIQDQRSKQTQDTIATEKQTNTPPSTHQNPEPLSTTRKLLSIPAELAIDDDADEASSNEMANYADIFSVIHTNGLAVTDYPQLKALPTNSDLTHANNASQTSLAPTLALAAVGMHVAHSAFKYMTSLFSPAKETRHKDRDADFRSSCRRNEPF